MLILPVFGILKSQLDRRTDTFNTYVHKSF